jgi:hypothetical protein
MNMNYVPVEYPKWVGGALVNSEAEERSFRAAPPLVLESDRPRSSAAIRMQRSRRRRSEGKRAVLCDISANHIEAMVVAGFIDPARRDDATEVARGVARSLDRMARSE